MEEHFLKDFVTGEPGFRTEPWYNPYGDCIEYQTVNEAVVADRIDGLLTIYRSALTDKPVGFQIKGVRVLLDKLRCHGVATLSSESENGQLVSVSLFAFLSLAYIQMPDTLERQHRYRAVTSLVPDDARLPLSELVPLEGSSRQQKARGERKSRLGQTPLPDPSLP